METYLGHSDEDNVSDDVALAIMKNTVVNMRSLLADVNDMQARGNLMWDSAMAENGILKVGRVTDFQCHQIEHQLGAYTDCNHGQGLAVIHPAYYRHIAKDAEENPVTEWEEKHAKEHLALLKDPHKLYKAYGCTLMAFVVTPTYWFAIHLGDGKCFAFYDQATGKVWDEPLPWDERCFLNKTTSLSQNDAYESFRFAYGGLQTLPLAVFMGSDGLDDTFADNDLLCDFYIKVLKEILFTSQAEVVDELEKSLPVLSKRGSLDDMSVACLYDEQKILDNISYILEHQISLVSSRIDSSARRVKELVTRKQDLENYLEVKDKFAIFNKRKKELEEKLGISSNTNIDIEMGFADKDIVREEEHIAQLTRKQESLVGERAKIDAITVEVDVEPAVEPITEIEVADVVSEEVVMQPDGESIELPPATEVGAIVETDAVKGLTHKEPHYINVIPATQEEK